MPKVIVTARQPLALGRRETPGAPVTTHRHIPGSVLRGALAKVWRTEHSPHAPGSAQRHEFVELFERGVRFGPLFTPGSTVVPLSVVRCKYQPQQECLGTWHDEATGKVVPEVCGACAGPLTRGRGEVEFFTADSAHVATRNTRVALTDGETAREGMLYSRDALRPRTATGAARTFTGRIVGDSPWLLEDHELLLGGRRSTSGTADYHAEPDQPAPPTNVGRDLVLRLISPAILVDAAGRPTTTPDTALLTKLLGTRVETERSWIRRERLGGWHDAAGLPKPEEHAITAGSTFHLQLDDEPDPESVRRLLDHGLGLRRVEGFGWIELGPTNPPDFPDDSSTSPGEHHVIPQAAEVIRKAEGNVARWLVGELKNYPAHLAAGGTPHTHLMGRPRTHRLTPTQRDVLHELLHRGDTAEIAKVINALDAHARGVLP